MLDRLLIALLVLMLAALLWFGWMVVGAEARPRDPFMAMVTSISKAFQFPKVRRYAARAHPTKVSPVRFAARKAKPNHVGDATKMVPPVGHPDLDRYDEAPRVARGSPNASWYGATGNPTASGERYDPMGPTCAHRRMKFGTLIRVTNLWNGKTATCRINDRGPFIAGRELDVSKGIAVQLGMMKTGTARVSFSVLGSD